MELHGEHGGWSGPAARLAGALRRDELLESDVVRALVRALCEEPPPGAWHPTGFVVLKLHHDAEGALRLHVWPAGTREHGQPCWPVHDHVWHLRSEVLCGEVESHGYAVHEDPTGDAVLYSVEYDHGRSSCMHRSQRRVAVRAEAAQRMQAGERYTVEAGAFHASRVGAEDLAATLVATTMTDRPRPWVVGPVRGPERVPVDRPLASAGSVRAMVRRVAVAVA